MRKQRKLMAMLGIGILATACGQSPIDVNGSDLGNELDSDHDGITANGAPDQNDNCPNDFNPGVPLLWEGQSIACAVPQNGLSAEDPIHWYINGDPRPEVCNPMGCAPQAVFCVDGEIVTQPDADLDGHGDVCDRNDDNDNFDDEVDRCPFFSSPDNGDNDEDGAGDPCDDDDDNDGVLDTCPPGSPEGCMADNCQFVANVDQSDMDFDGDGDACDEFMDCAGDEDGIPDAPGACLPPDQPPADPSAMDSDSDGEHNDTDCDSGNPLRSHLLVEVCDDGVDNDCDLVTDVLDPDCDPDLDDDGVLNADDNCPMDANPGQEDMDDDGAGDACDLVDNRQCANGGDMCPLETDLCVDGGCEADPDGDGVGNGDNCPDMANADQADMDGDGLGDVCDEVNGLLCANGGAQCDAGWVCLNGECVTDGDGDGAADVQDNCPMNANADQADGDMDGTGDACDDCPADMGGFNACGACGAVPAEVCDVAMADENCNGVANEGCDTDGDMVTDDVDNCPAVANASQMDRDGNGVGDACDPICSARIHAAQGWTLNYTLSAVVNGGYPVGPWDQSGDTELCVYANEALLVISTDGHGNYSLSGWPAVRNAAAYEPGYGPTDFPGFAPVNTPSGPDDLRLPLNN